MVFYFNRYSCSLDYIYISSGREPGCKLYIGKCPVQCSSKQNPFLKRYQPKFPSDFPIAASKELEGVHSDGKRLVACVSRADAKYVYIKAVSYTHLTLPTKRT